jgi:hypothetical protein
MRSCSRTRSNEQRCVGSRLAPPFFRRLCIPVVPRPAQLAAASTLVLPRGSGELSTVHARGLPQVGRCRHEDDRLLKIAGWRGGGVQESKGRTQCYGTNYRAAPEILHGYNRKVTGETVMERLDMRCGQKADKHCK